MTAPVRFAYADTAASRAEGSLLAYVPITLLHGTHVVTVAGLLDTGSTVNVLPYPLGLQLGLVWEQQPTRVHLTGSLARLPARGVIVSGQVASFPVVELAFAWTQSTEVPMILGQVNFFMEFDVCFFRSQAAFEINPKGQAK
jgi:Aspartyl protease